MNSPTPDMQRFLLQENVKMFRARLAEAELPNPRELLQVMLAGAERELSLLEASERGVQAPWRRDGGPELDAAKAAAIERFHDGWDGSGINASLLDPSPGLPFVAVAGVSDVASGRPRSGLIGQALFSLFPENPADPSAEGVRLLYNGLRGAADTGKDQTIPPFRYDVAASDGTYSERWWQSTTRPIFDEEKRLLFVMLLSEDITSQVLSAGADGSGQAA